MAAAAEAIPLVARIKEQTLREEYARQLAGWLGTEPDPILARVRRAATAERDQQQRRTRAESVPANGSAAQAAAAARPNPAEPGILVEREALKLALQQPELVAGGYDQVQAEAFTHPSYAAVHAAVIAAGGPESAPRGPVWISLVAEQLPAGPLRSLVTELSVEPPRHRSDEQDAHYAGSILAGMAERMAARSERTLRSALQRAEANRDREQSQAIQADLMAMAAYRRALADRAKGELA